MVNRGFLFPRFALFGVVLCCLRHLFFRVFKNIKNNAEDGDFLYIYIWPYFLMVFYNSYRLLGYCIWNPEICFICYFLSCFVFFLISVCGSGSTDLIW